MKVWELKKINEYAHKNNIQLDYLSLLQYKQEDIDLIIDCIDQMNRNVESLIIFMQWDLDNPYLKTTFEHLEGIENFDIRKYLIEKMKKAFSKKQAEAILKNFDLASRLFRNLDEWKAYIDSIAEKMLKRESLIGDNLTLVLHTQEEDRIDLIKQIMEYSQLIDLNPKTISEYFSSEIIEKNCKEVLSLLIKGYNVEGVARVFANWNNLVKFTMIHDQDEETQKATRQRINTIYYSLVDYLENSTLFCASQDSSSLINIFDTDFEKIPRFISIFKEIENKNDKELFEQCLECSYLDNENMEYYIRHMLDAKDQANDYVVSLYYLWNQGVIEKNISSQENIERIITALELAQEKDESSMDMADFLMDIPNIEIIKDMKITERNRETREEVLYNEFPKFIKEVPLSDPQIENYCDWLTKLSTLPKDVCEKVMNIINISIIKNMSIEEQIKIKELVLNPENFGSLDYIYYRYREKEQEYNQYQHQQKQPLVSSPTPTYEPEVKLVTVIELLECDHDFDKVLDGFNDDEEITPKTLIRTLAYKNNQNN